MNPTQPSGRPRWQQMTALVSLSTSGAMTGFSLVPGAAAADLASPAGTHIRLLALQQAAHPAAPDQTTLRSAIVNVAQYYLRMAQTKTPAEMEALIWQHDSIDGVDHGQSCAAFASLTLELAAQVMGQQSWVTGGTSYPWPLHKWADVRVNPNPGSPGIVSVLQDAQAHHRWHPLGDRYRPLPGDWVLFDGHIEVVTAYSRGVLHTIGGDSGANLSVNAHTYANPLSAQGVAGFVDNGASPSAPAAPAEATAAPGAGWAPPQHERHSAPGEASVPGVADVLAAQPAARASGSAAVAVPAVAGPGPAVRTATARAAPVASAGSASVPGAGVNGQGSGIPGSALQAPHRARAARDRAPADRPARPRVLHPGGATAAGGHQGRGSRGAAGPNGSAGAGAGGGARTLAAAQVPGTGPAPTTVPELAAQRGGAAIPGLQPAPARDRGHQASPRGGRYTRHQPAAILGTPPTGGSQQAFIRQVAAGAIATQWQYGVPAAVTIAQAIDESGWGQSYLATRDYNLFGIKGAGPGGTDMQPTQEVINGQTVTQIASFRVYQSIAQSIDDHAQLLASSPYYAQAMAQSKDPNAFASSLTGVYATDPAYGQKLIALMQRYDLYRYDASAQAPVRHTAGHRGTAGRQRTRTTSPGPGSATSGVPVSTGPQPGATSSPAPGASSAPVQRTPSSSAVAGGGTSSPGASTGQTPVNAAGGGGARPATAMTGAGTVPGKAGRGGSAPGRGPSTPVGGALIPGLTHHGIDTTAFIAPAATASPGTATAPSASAVPPSTAGPGASQSGSSAGGAQTMPAPDSVSAQRIPAPAHPQPRRITVRATRARTTAYQLPLPARVKNAFNSKARPALYQSQHLYHDVASRTGISWEILAACDWMQCEAKQHLSPVYGEKLGRPNPDGTSYRTRSAALKQCAEDLVDLASAVYQIDLRAPGYLSVRDLANVFAAFRWGALLKLHNTSAMEFPYSVAGLTGQHLNMRWPNIDVPNLPDKPGGRFHKPFGAVPVVLSLEYPATI